MFRLTRNLKTLLDKGPSYPFMVWVPTERSFDPPSYNKVLKQAPGRNAHFLCVPVTDKWRVWGFETKADLDSFCQDLINASQSSD